MFEVSFIAAGFLEPLRAYPRWLVLLCAGLALGGLLVLVAKPLKWALYLGLLAVFAILMALFARWLER